MLCCCQMRILHYIKPSFSELTTHCLCHHPTKNDKIWSIFSDGSSGPYTVTKKPLKRLKELTKKIDSHLLRVNGRFWFQNNSRGGANIRKTVFRLMPVCDISALNDINHFKMTTDLYLNVSTDFHMPKHILCVRGVAKT